MALDYIVIKLFSRTLEKLFCIQLELSNFNKFLVNFWKKAMINEQIDVQIGCKKQMEKNHVVKEKN